LRGSAILTAWVLSFRWVAAEPDVDLKDPKLVTAGHTLFLQKQCAHCHGEDGRGGINLARRELDSAGVFQSIAEGREKNGIRMPAWRGVLTDEEIWQATAYVMSIAGQAK
jgi:mono/diheme cytochrome c family protein